MSISLSDAIRMHVEEEARASLVHDPRAMSKSTLHFIDSIIKAGRLCSKALEGPLQALSLKSIEDFRADLLGHGLSEAYARKHLDLISGATHYAWKNGYVTYDLMQLWRARRRPRKTKATRGAAQVEIDTLGKEAIHALLSDSERRGLNVFPALLLAIGSGLRLGEIRGLRWKHVSDCHLPAGLRLLHIKESWPVAGDVGEIPKTGASRYVLYAELFRSWAREHRDLDEALVMGKTDPRNMLTSLSKLAIDVGIVGNVNWLTLRHTFASQLLTNGFPIDWIAAQMGNTPSVCAKHYARFIDPWRRPVAVPDGMCPMDTIFDPGTLQEEQLISS